MYKHNHIIQYILIGAIIGSGFIGAKLIINKKLEDKLETSVQVAADTDKNGVTSKNEWIEVYRDLNIHYNELNPKQLNIEQMNKYLTCMISLI